MQVICDYVLLFYRLTNNQWNRLMLAFINQYFMWFFSNNQWESFQHLHNTFTILNTFCKTWKNLKKVKNLKEPKKITSLADSLWSLGSRRRRCCCCRRFCGSCMCKSWATYSTFCLAANCWWICSNCSSLHLIHDWLTFCDLYTNSWIKS